MKHLLFYTFFILNMYVLTMYNSCTSGSSSGSQSVSNIYKSSQDNLHPKYVVFHRTNTTSELHFKINSARNPILGRKPTSGMVNLGLLEFSRLGWRGADNVIVATEIVERTVLIPEDFQGAGRGADIIAIGFNLDAGLAGLDLDIVGDGALRSMLN